MTIRREGGDRARACLIGFNVVLWASGIVLIIIGIWMLVDPTRSYILDLVNFSEDDPLLIFASYTCIFTGIGTIFVGLVACWGAIRRMRCLLVALIAAMVALFICGVAIGTLALVFQNKFPNESRMTLYIANMTHNRYGRDKWVKPLLDTIQFYQQCCGGVGPADYHHSFWFTMNTDRGTRSFVPPSCCRQTQAARAWAIAPIDPMCTIYYYETKVFSDFVHTEGCGPKLYRWFSDQTTIFAVVGFSFAALQVIGIAIAFCMCAQVRYYHYVKDEVY